MNNEVSNLNYNFDEVIDRTRTNSLKWEVSANELPMWVADMDFKTAPCVIEAVTERAMHGVFGYNILPQQWYSAYINRWKKRHGFEIKKEWLMFCTGVIPAISSSVRKLTTPAENVLVMTPVYNIFFNSIINNGRNVLESPLKYENNDYSIDFDDLEFKLSMPQTTMMILCNPHNPSGKIWDRKTLEKIGELCKKYDVIVLSDEIHCDLTDPDKKYVPFASVSDTCRDISITYISPTKAFNIAGLQTAAFFSANKNLYNKMNRALNTDEVAEPNCFAVCAAVAAYTNGDVWLDELRAYIYNNKCYATDFINKNIPQLTVVNSESTYLLWLDISKLFGSSDEFTTYLRKYTGLFLSDGMQYRGNGKDFVRMNIACSKTVLTDGLNRLKQGTYDFNKQCLAQC